MEWNKTSHISQMKEEKKNKWLYPMNMVFLWKNSL